jgi:DNA-binding CsgD family transcriptional regulator
MPVTEDTNTNSHPETECTSEVRLSRRELEVLSLIAEGRSTREIAAALWVTEETIKSHVSRVLRRLEARTRAHAVAIAYRDGLWAKVEDDERRPTV